MKKTLVILCNSYPHREFFLGDELDYTREAFDEVITLRREDVKKDWRKKYSLPKMITWVVGSKAYWHEWRYILFQKKILPSISLAKMVTSQILFARMYLEAMLEMINTGVIDPDNTLFYSYWNDEKALALAMLKEHYPQITSISRAHGWDYDYRRQHPAYLPFKPLLLESIDTTYVNSDYGEKCLREQVDSSLYPKIQVARMGKSNPRPVKKTKETKDEYVISTCCRVIPLKRVDLIMKLVQELSVHIPVKWVHFGKEDELRLADIYKENHFDFPYEAMGMVDNEKVLDYYSENYIDLYVSFSTHEGLPISIMEAQSAGMPVMATSVGGVAEIVNMTNGFLVDKDVDIEKAVETILAYFSSDADTIQAKRDASYQNWKENYDAEVNYRDFASMISKV